MNYVALGILQAACVIAWIAIIADLLLNLGRSQSAPRKDTAQERRLAEIRADWAQPQPSWQAECEAQRQARLKCNS
jgi:hypothetical protein